MEDKWNKSQQLSLAAKKADCMLGCVSKIAAPQGSDLFLLSASYETTSGVWGWECAFWGSQYKEDIDIQA